MTVNAFYLKTFAILILFLGIFCFTTQKANAVTDCTINNPPEVFIDDQYQVIVTLETYTRPSFPPRWIKLSSGVSTEAGNPILGALPETPAATGKGQAVFDLKAGFNPTPQKFNAEVCENASTTICDLKCDSTHTTIFKVKPNTTPPARACWYLLGGSVDCIDACKPGEDPSKGQFATEAECKTAATTIVQQPTPGRVDPTITKFPVPTPPCDNPEPNGICTEVKTAVGVVKTDPAGFIKWFFGFLLGIGGGIALLLIIYSGYKLMTSRGDPERTKGAKETFTSAIIGLVFLIFSMVILQVIAGTILNVPGLK